MTRKQVALWIFASVGLFAAAGAGVAARIEGGAGKARVTTVGVTRGNVVVTVRATGSVEAVDTVQVGTQVSGTVQNLYADFNSLVQAGQVLARLDPSVFQTQVEQARANVARSEADIEQLKVALADAQLTLDRNTKLAEKQLVAAADLEGFAVAVRLAKAQVKSAEAGLAQAKATLRQAQVNLAQTVISSPIGGIVISRSVDEGQTVAASMQAPTLFVLAADLRQMRVNASVDESDVGQVSAGQSVTFTVDAFPNDTFQGRVSQVRLQPDVSQNVVTYTTVIDVNNPQLKLRPGMTANVSIEVARRDQVLTVPSAALRFKPTATVLAALGRPPSAAASRVEVPAAAPASGLARATLWRYDGTKIDGLKVATGISDGVVTEIVSGPLAEGDEVVTSASTTTGSAGVTTATKTTSAASNPLLGGMSGPRGGMGGPH